MAIYHEDIANIELSSGQIFRSFMNHTIGSGDVLANRFGVRVFRNGEPENIGGTCMGLFIRADGTTVTISSGVVSGNVAYVTLPEACYAVEGQFSLAIKCQGSGVTGTLRIVDGVVSRTSTSAVVDPGTLVPSIEDLIDAIEDAVETIPADYSGLWTTLAPAFSTSTKYKAGQYVTYDGKMYKFTTDHAAGTWNSAHVTQVNVGGETSDLKSAFDCMQYEETDISAAAYSGRVKFISSKYIVKNNIVKRFIALQITTDALTGTNDYTLGTIGAPRVSYVAPHKYSITFDAVAIDGTDLSGYTFSLTNDATNNILVSTTETLPRNCGGTIILTNEQAFLNTEEITETAYDDGYTKEILHGENIFKPEWALDDYAWNATNNEIGNYSNWSYTQLRAVPGTSIKVTGLSQSATTLGYAVRSRDGEVLKSGGLSNGMIVDIPADGCYFILSFPTDDTDNLSVVVYKKRKIVVLGDSWSDNDPEHTTWTKWTTLLQADGRFDVIVYAQNGSTITGDTPVYAQNGNVQGQVDKFISDKVENVDTIILLGGINDFRGGIAASSVYAKIGGFYATLNASHPTARIIYISNNQIFITKEQLIYFHTIGEYLRENIGIEWFNTFGWVKASNYLSDNVHVDNEGYKDLYANILSILSGGSVVTIRSSQDVTLNKNGSATSNVITIVEDWVNGYPVYSAKALIYVQGLDSTLDREITTGDGLFLASVPFTMPLWKYLPTSLNTKNAVFVCDAEESFTTQNKLNTENTFTVITPETGDGYYAASNFI